MVFNTNVSTISLSSFQYRLWSSNTCLLYTSRIKDDAIIAAVELSSRYITDRFLPDKAIDLMDEACLLYTSKRRKVLRQTSTLSHHTPIAGNILIAAFQRTILIIIRSVASYWVLYMALTGICWNVNCLLYTSPHSIVSSLIMKHFVPTSLLVPVSGLSIV